jgi:hypothetical protein
LRDNSDAFDSPILFDSTDLELGERVKYLDVVKEKKVCLHNDSLFGANVFFSPGG